MYIIPNEKRWTQANLSDRFGSIFTSRNISLDKDGYVTLNAPSTCIANSLQYADLGAIFSIQYSSDGNVYWILTDTGIYTSDIHLSTFIKNEDTDVPTTFNSEPDMCIFDGNIIVNAGLSGDAKMYDGSAWNTITSVGGVSQTPLCVCEHRNSLAVVTNDNELQLFDVNFVSQVTLVIPATYAISTIAWANNRLYIGTRNRHGGNAMLFEWDGNTSAVNNGTQVQSPYIESVVPYEGSVALMTGGGQLLYFTGGGFQVLANFPMYNSNLLYSTAGDTVASAHTRHRGMVVHDGKIYMNVYSKYKYSGYEVNTVVFENNALGGVWCYDKERGLYHYAGIVQNASVVSPAVPMSDVNTGTYEITLAETNYEGGVKPLTGTPVVYYDGFGANIEPLVHGETYYYIDAGTDLFALASTAENAQTNNRIAITTTGNDAQYFLFRPKYQYSDSFMRFAGAITTQMSRLPKRKVSHSLLFGGKTLNGYGDIVDVLCTLVDDMHNVGYITTTRLESSRITDDFINITLKYKGINTDFDKIVVKYRTILTEADSHKIKSNAATEKLTWSDTSSFVTLKDIGSNHGAHIGDEVEIHEGAGCGSTAHITDITQVGNEYTVVLDEALNITGQGTESYFTVDTWQKVGAITRDDNSSMATDVGDLVIGNGGSKTFSLSKKCEWIQFKIELRGSGVMLEDILVNNTPFKQFTA